MNPLKKFKLSSNQLNGIRINVLINNMAVADQLIFIKSAKGLIETKIDENTFTQIILQAVKLDQKEQAFNYLFFDTHQFLVRIINKQLHLYLIGQPIGQGSSSTIMELLDLVSGKVFAYKQSVLSSLNQLLTLNEYFTLRKIHKNNCVRGIQALPSDLVEISFKENFLYRHVTGYITEKYDMHLLDYIDYLISHIKNARKNFQPDNDTNLFILKKINESIQLLTGVVVLNEANIFHRDLSYTNILIKFENNFNTFHIADFGSAIDLNTISDIRQIPTLCGFVYSIDDYVKQVNFIPLCFNQDYFYLLKQMDIYAMGILLKKFTNCLIDELPLLKYNQQVMSILDLIQQMTNKDYKARPTALSLRNWIKADYKNI